MGTTKTWHSIHRITALGTGWFIAILCLTGSVAVFKAEIDRLLNPGPYDLPAHASAHSLSAEAVHNFRRQQQADGLLPARFYELPQSPADPLIAHAYASPEKKSANPLRKLEGYRYEQYFLHPETGQVLHKRDVYSSAQYYIRTIHVRLYDFLLGRYIVGLFGLGFLLSLVSGLVIYGPFLKKGRHLSIRRFNWRTMTVDWHRLIGAIALLFNLIIALSGAWLGLFGLILAPFDVDAPNRYEAPPERMTAAADSALVPPLAPRLDSARAAMTGFVPKTVQLSKDGSGLIHVSGDIPGEVYERQTHKVVLDKRSGEPRFRYRNDEDHAAARLYYVQEALHFGDYDGLPVKILYALLGLTGAFLAFSGHLTYLMRVRKYSFRRGMRVLGRWVAFMLLFILLTLVSHLWFGAFLTNFVVVYQIVPALLGGYLLFRLFQRLRNRWQNPGNNA